MRALSVILQWTKHSFYFGNRSSYALPKYPNFPALLRREIWNHFSCHPTLENLPFFENICEYYQGSSNARSTVFVLITDFLMPFQNTLISRHSSAEKSDHFSFMSSTFTKSSYILRTYVNIINVLAMC